ncbi:PP2C family protein-serine/threonine phosphatase [Streptomyces sp. SLBN-118]|uniref:PP2C family protein-serine/threonine phosphatase n=1 Tax=Streptomyces sp. SLBN-118 TaxID=2768454 RepID=UPI0028C39B7D|nr:PP2C family protein-serine/threonine phosphatase [Streptomyces sp. SLBN-118]
MINCGHPSPLLLRGGRVTALDVRRPAPPLGLTEIVDFDVAPETFAFEPGDIILLYTDGVIEARDRSGAFYPLGERVARWTGEHPETLLRRLCRDLLGHVGESLGDDATMRRSSACRARVRPA